MEGKTYTQEEMDNLRKELFEVQQNYFVLKSQYIEICELIKSIESKFNKEG